ncbi:MAG: EamA family transporter [Anaerolineales bacterium]|jgi:drug/metabolite transporter (DMT)-like permease
MEPSLIAAVLALSAAAAWGAGDFANGLAARRAGPQYAVLFSYLVGLLILVVAAFARSEPLPPFIDLVWGALAGLSGMIGLLCLLRGFAIGRMGIVAPVSAVLAALVPVVFAAATSGLPEDVRLVGFALALASIWLLSRPEKFGGRPAGLIMALLAGLSFGGFFILLDQIGDQAIFWPLVAGRLVACALMLAFVLFTRRPLFPAQLPLGLLTLAGVLDVGGNLLFLLAVQSGRLDVAAVLVSFYPAVTALLAWLIIREQLARLQIVGVSLAVLAIVLITI